MLIIPAIDLLDGRCVRLLQGDYRAAIVYDEDPVARVRSFAQAGAKRVHVVDLDAARDRPGSRAVVESLVRYAGVEVQVAGGIRRVDTASAWLQLGATQVVVGTAAVEDPATVMAMAGLWPQRVYVAVDARAGKTAIHGWERDSSLLVWELLDRFAEAPLAGFICTDIERDGLMTGVDAGGYAALVGRSVHPIIASGGVTTVDDIHRLQDLGVAGVILGRALYEGRLSVEQAMSAAMESPA